MVFVVSSFLFCSVSGAQEVFFISMCSLYKKQISFMWLQAATRQTARELYSWMMFADAQQKLRFSTTQQKEFFPCRLCKHILYQNLYKIFLKYLLLETSPSKYKVSYVSVLTGNQYIYKGTFQCPFSLGYVSLCVLEVSIQHEIIQSFNFCQMQKFWSLVQLQRIISNLID